jgi:hypothetical protein
MAKVKCEVDRFLDGRRIGIPYQMPSVDVLAMVRMSAVNYDKRDVAKIDKAVDAILDSGVAPISRARMRLHLAIGKLSEYMYSVESNDVALYNAAADTIEMALAAICQQKTKAPVIKRTVKPAKKS